MALDLDAAAAPILALVEAPDFAAAVAARAGRPVAEVAPAIADVASEVRLAVQHLGLAALGLRTGDRVLELGAGSGITTAILARAGLAVRAIDPLIDGFELFAHLGAELAARAGALPAVEPRAAAELDPARDGTFDVIFSINVLEHCRPLPATLDALAGVLAPGGRMLHACANYRVPYEPHLGTPLLPFAPQLTARLVPSMARHPMWPTLNFITAGDLVRFARRTGLTCAFVPGILSDAVARLARDPAFARRQRRIAVVARAVERTGLLAWLPPSWQTPMVAIITRPAAR